MVFQKNIISLQRETKRERRKPLNRVGFNNKIIESLLCIYHYLHNHNMIDINY